MKKILILMLLSLSLLNPIHCMEKDPEIETSGFESLPPEMWQRVFAIIIEDHFNSYNDIFGLYRLDKNRELRKILAMIKLVSKSFFTFSDEELEKFITRTKKNRSDLFKNCIKNQYAGSSQEELDNQLCHLLYDIHTKNESETQEHLKKAVELILAGADINLQTSYSETTLILASQKGYTEIVQLLVDHNADINLQDKYGLTALIRASNNGHTEIVQLLLDHSANIDLQDEYGLTALILAARNGYTEVVQLLLDHNANINLQTIIGDSALMGAMQNDHIKIVRLLQNKADQLKICDT